MTRKKSARKAREYWVCPVCPGLVTDVYAGSDDFDGTCYFYGHKVIKVREVLTRRKKR